MSTTPLSFRWPQEFVDRIDAVRGEVPRARFIRVLVDEALAARQLRGPQAGPVAPNPSRYPRVASSAEARARVRPIPKAGQA